MCAPAAADILHNLIFEAGGMVKGRRKAFDRIECFQMYIFSQVHGSKGAHYTRVHIAAQYRNVYLYLIQFMLYSIYRISRRTAFFDCFMQDNIKSCRISI